MSLISRIRLTATLVSAGLAIAAVCTLVSVFDSLQRELNQWSSGRYDSLLRIMLLPPGTQQHFEDAMSQRIEGLELFRPPFDQSPQPEAGEPPAPLFFQQSDITYLQNLPMVNEVIWERALFSPYVAGTDMFEVYQVTHSYFEALELKLADGRLPAPGHADGVLILGSEAHRQILGSAPAGGQSLPPSAWGWNGPLVVSGVLEPASAAHAALADFMDRKIYYLAGTGDPAQEGLLLNMWILPQQGKTDPVIEQIHRYFESEYTGKATLQIGSKRSDGAIFGGIAMRQFLLLRFVWVVGLATLAAAVNIFASLYSIFAQQKFALGVKRSLGAEKTNLLNEKLPQFTLYGVVSGFIGVALSHLLLAWLGSALQICTINCAEVHVSTGWLTIAVGIGLGVGLWGLGSFAALSAFMRESPSALLRGAALSSGWLGAQTGRMGIAISIFSLIVILGLRDGISAQFDQILGWSGGERSGAFVSWTTQHTQPGGAHLTITRQHYQILKSQLPHIPVGWLSAKGSTSEMIILDASASLGTLRPPVLQAGRWFTPEEETTQNKVTVLGPELAKEYAQEQGISISELIGQQWRIYTIIGVMDVWPALHAMGYYPDAAYVPVGARDSTYPYWPLIGQIPFLVPAEQDINAAVDEMRTVLESQNILDTFVPAEQHAQVLLPATVIGESLQVRQRIYNLMGLFALFCLFIGATGAMNWVFLWVVRRWREIGIRRALGAEQKTILAVILKETALQVLAGAILGSALGLPIALFIQHTSNWPLTFYPYWLAVATGIALLTSLVFGGFPALWAATRPPTGLLRME